MIEWNYPAGVNLDGVEFNSMVSGAHTIAKDFVYVFERGTNRIKVTYTVPQVFQT